MGTVSLHQCMGHFMAMASLAPLISQLATDEYVQEKVAETARQFFSNSFLTVSLWPAIIVGALFLLLGLPLLSMIFGESGGSTGYGAPEPSYGAPEPSYGAPSSSYGYRGSAAPSMRSIDDSKILLLRLSEGLSVLLTSCLAENENQINRLLLKHKFERQKCEIKHSNDECPIVTSNVKPRSTNIIQFH